MYARLRRLLFRIDPERAHRLATLAARSAQSIAPSWIDNAYHFEHESLSQDVWGTTFPNPIGLAAGFDKNGRLVRFWSELGFGFAEIGSVSALPARGNPRPRLFRLPEDRALINRMGLNNDGAARVARRLRSTDRGTRRPLGINLAKTHNPSILGEAGIEDFRTSFRLLAPLADYIALNVSCPNTAEGKTFETPETLDALLRAVFEERRTLGVVVPVLVKLSPPLTDRVVFDSLLEELLSIALEHGVQGFIASNTASDREGLSTREEVIERIGRGGLSGAPLATRSTRLVRYLYRRLEGKVPIVGVGGIFTARDVYEKMRAGASLVQLYTGLIYGGPGVIQEIKGDLVDLIAKQGVSRIREIVGADA